MTDEQRLEEKEKLANDHQAAVTAPEPKPKSR